MATSLPRRDVPGLRFVKTAVRFANNPPAIHGNAVELGGIVDMGVERGKSYALDRDALVRHTLVAGASGYGKTSTCKSILSAVMEAGVSVMVIEPAKRRLCALGASDQPELA